MKPLTTWTCDTCGQQVEPTLGTVVARYTDDEVRLPTGFRIVHKNIGGLQCDPGSAAGYRFNLDLHTLTGPEGAAKLLAYLSPGPLRGGGGPVVADVDEFVDLFRRLQTPFYEQARERFTEERVRRAYADANEHLPYMPGELEQIAAGNVG